MKLIPIERSEWDAVMQQWAGAEVQLWLYHITFRRLLLAVRPPGQTHPVYVLAVGCKHMEGPFSWDEAALEVIEAGAKGPEETLALVVDRSRGFRLSCSSVVLYRGSGDDFPKSFDDFDVDD